MTQDPDEERFRRDVALEAIKHENQQRLEELKYQNQQLVENQKAKYQLDLEAIRIQAAQRLAGRIEQKRAHASTKTAQAANVGRFADIGLRSIVLVNAGSVIGLLTFTGNLWARDSATAAKLAENSFFAMAAFVVGVVAGLFAILFSYGSQVVILERDHTKAGDRWGGGLRIVALGFAVASAVLFAVGARIALLALATAKVP